MPDPQPSPSPNGAPPPSPPASLPPGADEGARFPSPAVDPFAGIPIPDKFRKDGKPDLAALVASYSELEVRQGSRTEEIKRQLAEEMAVGRPKAATEYQIPKLDGIDQAELAAHPMVAWWRDEAFAAGLPQDKFEKGVTAFIERMQPEPIPEATLQAELGDNWKARIGAVDAWAAKTAKTPGEMEALKRVGTDPDGIRLLERMAGLARPLAADDPTQIQPGLSLDQLRAMQNDPRYWNPASRDADFVRKVEEGYARLYPDGKRAG